MGGYSSGRRRTRNRGSIDETIKLDIRDERRFGVVRSGQRRSARVAWKSGRVEAGAVKLTTDLTDMSRPYALIEFSFDGDRRSQRIELTAVPCRYGGCRFYFLCPVFGHRCEVLPSVDGYFASRQAHRLTFRSQTSGTLERMRDRAEKLERRLYGQGRQPKPRGKNRERLMAAWDDAHAAWSDAVEAEGLRRFGDAIRPWL